ncbi:MAG: dolichol-phosphate mannosyltransferase [Planctomycetota bacterium]
MTAVEISVVVPLFNEEDNVQPLLDELLPVLAGITAHFEVLLIDDGSTDTTAQRIAENVRQHPQIIRHLSMRQNTGQTAAIEAGFRASLGRLLVMMDGDLQVDSQDIPMMIEKTKEFDLVHGWRWQRKDTPFKRLQTAVANGVRNRLTKSDVRDTGCPLKVFRREVVESFKLYTGMHRFFVTLARMEGFSTCEVKVKHRPRFAGVSKYGMWNRVFRAFRDLFAIRWMMARRYRLDFEEIEAPAEKSKGANPVTESANGNSGEDLEISTPGC